MNTENRLKELESWLLGINNIPEEVEFKANQSNAWFTPTNIKLGLVGIQNIVQSIRAQNVLKRYEFKSNTKKIGLVLAGNIPFVGFHDIISVLLSGHTAYVKLSSQDTILFHYLLEELKKTNTDLASCIKPVLRLDINNLDAVIATGSNNTARYFETYFSKVPNIIRKSRTSVAMLKGDESILQLENLGKDVFTYFGLGCRNVSKIFIPKNYDLSILLDAWTDFDHIMDLSKYANNYTYYKSAFLVNSTEHLDTGFVLVTESEDLVSPIGVIYIQRYSSDEELLTILKAKEDQIQCVVGEGQIVNFGDAQDPEFLDYADGIDTLTFLTSL